MKIDLQKIIDSLYTPFRDRQAKYPQGNFLPCFLIGRLFITTIDQILLQRDLLETLSGYSDLYLMATKWDHSKCIREALSLHVLNHVVK
jgi:hypothetical protein